MIASYPSAKQITILYSLKEIKMYFVEIHLERLRRGCANIEKGTNLERQNSVIEDSALQNISSTDPIITPSTPGQVVEKARNTNLITTKTEKIAPDCILLENVEKDATDAATHETFDRTRKVCEQMGCKVKMNRTQSYESGCKCETYLWKEQHSSAYKISRTSTKIVYNI